MATLREAVAQELADTSALLHAQGALLANELAQRPPPLARLRRSREGFFSVLECVASAGYTAEAGPLLGLCRGTLGNTVLTAALLRCPHSPRRRTRLMHAARVRDRARLAFLLGLRGGSQPMRADALVCQADATGRTALHYAAAAGDARAAAALLAALATTGAAQPGGLTPLHCAARSSLAVVRVLLAAGADASAVGAWRDERQPIEPRCHSTPLGIACVAGRAETVRALLAAGAGAAINARLDGNRTCSAAFCRFPLLPGGDARAAFASHVAHRAAMSSRQYQWGDEEPCLRFSLLHLAAVHGHLDVVQALLEGGAEYCNWAVSMAKGDDMRQLLQNYDYKEVEAAAAAEEEEEEGEEEAE